jgi:hypothetical protein
VYVPEQIRAFGLNFVFERLHFEKNFDNGRLLWAGIFQPAFTKRTSGQCSNFTVSPPSLHHPTFSLQSLIQSFSQYINK